MSSAVAEFPNCGLHGVAVPGAPKFTLASSITRTQSFESGGLKVRVPELAKLPINVVAPLLGLNHQHFAVPPALRILLISMVIVLALPLGMYAMMVWPSLVLAAVVKDV